MFISKALGTQHKSKKCTRFANETGAVLGQAG